MTGLQNVGLALSLALAGCQAADVPRVDVFRPDYRGVETRLLEGDLVNFIVTMAGARDDEDVDTYARCAAAQYALIRGFGFARHVRTTVQEEGGLWRADAVYTVSPDLPRGVRTIDAEVVVDNCHDQGIPTV
ncbi:hypothetical protein [Jannaschia sp. 2305UL9-9]|uniref:hypothetical protein n=1 Tax=Jannaschia sp. 2305UL9-9 TaxID=3121638 RepID=UPI0035293F4F